MYSKREDALTGHRSRGQSEKTIVVAWANRHRKWIFASPAMLFVALLMAVPLAWTLLLSVTNSRGSVRAPFDFVGLDNYQNVLSDMERFWPAAFRTFAFTGAAVSAELILGMAIALLLKRHFKGQKWVRIVILLPLVATPVAVGMMWLLIFEPNIGFANELMSWLGLPEQGWLSNPDTALATLVFVDIWQWTPMVALLLLAGLTSLPEEPYEAAEVDGASASQRFWYVTLPLLTPTIVAAFVLRAIDALKTFDIIVVTKGSAGGSSHEVETLNIYAYALSFTYNQYGLASAVIVVFFVLLIVVVAIAMLGKRVNKHD